MITPGRDAVIENIRNAANEGRLNDKVEIGDPVLTSSERARMLTRYLKVRRSSLFRLKNRIACIAADHMTRKLNRTTEIVGLENARGVGPAFITTNHFNPAENTEIRLLSRKLGRKKLYVISQDTNLKMSGIFGFFMYYMDIIPISINKDYMIHHFESLIDEAFSKGQNILIYPEQEMWFNYRKPRTLKRGAYYYAARFSRPVIPCFTEIRDLENMEAENFHEVKYILHVLTPIWPDPKKSVRENSIRMMEEDYRLKIQAYEEAYGKKLDYAFSPDDIAGWVPETSETEDQEA